MNNRDAVETYGALTADPSAPLATRIFFVNLGPYYSDTLQEEHMAMPDSPALPVQGPMPTPESPDEARTVMRDSAFEAPDVQTVKLFTMEFTSLCPKTGQPDFGTVSIEYLPDALCLESKSLKYYLWAFRNVGEFCESLASRIADDIVFAIRPKHLQVEVTQNVRGGIAIVARAVRGASSR